MPVHRKTNQTRTISTKHKIVNFMRFIQAITHEIKNYLKTYYRLRLGGCAEADGRGVEKNKFQNISVLV